MANTSHELTGSPDNAIELGPGGELLARRKSISRETVRNICETLGRICCASLKDIEVLDSKAGEDSFEFAGRGRAGDDGGSYRWGSVGGRAAGIYIEGSLVAYCGDEIPSIGLVTVEELRQLFTPKDERIKTIADILRRVYEELAKKLEGQESQTNTPSLPAKFPFEKEWEVRRMQTQALLDEARQLESDLPAQSISHGFHLEHFKNAMKPNPSRFSSDLTGSVPENFDKTDIERLQRQIDIAKEVIATRGPEWRARLESEVRKLSSADTIESDAIDWWQDEYGNGRVKTPVTELRTEDEQLVATIWAVPPYRGRVELQVEWAQTGTEGAWDGKSRVDTLTIVPINRTQAG